MKVKGKQNSSKKVEYVKVSNPYSQRTRKEWGSVFRLAHIGRN